MSEAPRRYNKLAFRDGLIIGVTQAVTLLLVIFAITIVLGNQQQKALDDIRDSNRAISCVLALPATEAGRSEGRVNALCLIPNSLAPVDSNGDGVVEVRS